MSRYGPLYPGNDMRPWQPAPCGHNDNWRPTPHCRGEDRCCRDDTSIRLRLFDGCGSCCDPCRHPLPPAAPPVTIVNPWNCRECAKVTLSVDECGNLVVYVKR